MPVATVARLFAVAGLAVDAYAHADLAASYDQVRSTISEGTVFRLEAAVAASVALLLAARGRSRVVLGLAWIVAVSAFGAVVLYRYVDVDKLGPLPDMHEPFWSTEKVISAIAEAAAAAALTAIIVGLRRTRRRDGSG